MPKPESASTQETAELIARFQLQTEEKLKAIVEGFRGSIESQERRIAQVTDRWTAIETSHGETQRQLAEVLHQVKQGVTEVNIALRESVAQAKKASDAARVYEKLRDSQPDFVRQVRELTTKLASVQDANTRLQSQLTDVSRRLDEFEVINSDLPEVKSTVRTMDRMVSDLNSSEQRRRKGIPT